MVILFYVLFTNGRQNTHLSFAVFLACSEKNAKHYHNQPGVADVLPDETSLAVRIKEKRLYSQAKGLQG